MSGSSEIGVAVIGRWSPSRTPRSPRSSSAAEGVESSPGVLDIVGRYGVEMSISEQSVAVCHEGRSADDALGALMPRTSESELDRS